jgi:hypothetical protein
MIANLTHRASRHSRIATFVTSSAHLVVRKRLLRTAAAALLVSALAPLGLASTASAATPLSLVVPQGTAFAYLGHWCGGIQEQVYATGWDTSGYPAGAAYLSTRCGGSGRGGGGHSTLYSAWVTVTWDFAGNLRSAAVATVLPPLNPAFSSTDSYGDQLYNASLRAYLVVPPPASPTVVGAAQVGDQFQVSWRPLANAIAVTSSTITATPAGSAAQTLALTVSGTATTGLIGPLQPSTSYKITVVTTDAGGSSAPSSALVVSSHAASIAPSAPTSVAARWTAPGVPGDMAVVTWAAAIPGDSPIDQYQATISAPDTGETHTQTVSGTTLTAIFSVSDNPDWTIIVRAHNAVGWGPASAPIFLGGA